MTMDVLSLARLLVGYDTISPSSGERACLEAAAPLLRTAGFRVRFDDYGPGRSSLCAQLRPDSGAPSLCLAGHIDTVPLGSAAWSVDPFAGEVRDGRLFGRGACDMKGGMAALVCAAVRAAPFVPPDRDLCVHMYGGEETGCEGSFHLVADPSLLGHPAAVVVGEPTDNLPLVGHKGALWLRGETTGRTAHASMPEQGDNALLTAMRAAGRILAHDFTRHAHPHLGPTTLTATTMHAGLNINSVPDSAVFTLDLRTVPEPGNAALAAAVAALAGDETRFTTLLDVPPVWSSPDDPWISRVTGLWAARHGRRNSAPGTVQFFTDAAAIRSALPSVPILIYGPGDPAMAHRTDEFCPVSQLFEAVSFYLDVIADWCGVDRARTGDAA